MAFLFQRSLRAAESWTSAAALAETLTPSVNLLERADMWRGSTWRRSWWLHVFVRTLFFKLDFCTLYWFNLHFFRSQRLASTWSIIKRRLATRSPTCLLSRGTWRGSVRLAYRVTQWMLCCRFEARTWFYMIILHFVVQPCVVDWYIVLVVCYYKAAFIKQFSPVIYLDPTV